MSANVKNQMRFQTTTAFTTTSTSYVDLLNSSGGSTIAVTITKAAGTDLLISGFSGASVSAANETLFLGVNDGTTDYDLGRIRLFSSGSPRLNAAGTRLITGLGAGTYTLKLRVKTAGGSTITFQSTLSSFITVAEVAAQAKTLTPSSAFTWTSSSYVDLLDASGGSAVSVTITKASGASTGLMLRATLSCVGNTVTNSSVTLGVNDGTTDWDVARLRVTSASHRQLVGEVMLTGLAAGTYTLKLRVKSSASVQINFNNATNSASLSALEVNV